MHAFYLDLALEQAKQRRGFCAPNPSVGAVLVKNNHVIASANHHASGESHAEVNAIVKAGNEAENATLYVTLEPCCHTDKKTPPCTELIIQKKIKQVIYAHRDPNPNVSGRGKKALTSAGIACTHLPSAASNEFYQSYTYWWQTKKPFITAKLALSLDGKIAGEEGRPVTITGAVAKEFTHLQRKNSDAILTTATTINHDNPLLNVRLPEKHYSKLIFVIDSQLTVSPSANVFNSAAKLIFFYDKELSPRLLNPKMANVTYIPIRKHSSGLSLPDIATFIGQMGIHDLWVEAGGKCFSSLIQDQLINRGYIYIAAKTLGNKAQDAFDYESNLFTASKNHTWKNLGEDILLEFNW